MSRNHIFFNCPGKMPNLFYRPHRPRPNKPPEQPSPEAPGDSGQPPEECVPVPTAHPPSKLCPDSCPLHQPGTNRPEACRESKEPVPEPSPPVFPDSAAPTTDAVSVGPPGPPGPAGPAGPTRAFSETGCIGSINSAIHFDGYKEHGQASGGLIFNAGSDKKIRSAACYILDEGEGTGSFQMAVLQPTGNFSARVVGVTKVMDSVAAGLLVLPLTNRVTLAANTIYYLAAFSNITGFKLGAFASGAGTALAPPINFRLTSLPGFAMGQSVELGGTDLEAAPWIAAFR